jgi:predicted transcriptional regulator
VLPLVQVGEKLSLLNRSRIDIIADILGVSGEGAKKTHIMYRCNLSFRQLHAYLNLLVDRKLLRKVVRKESSRQELYETTPKGKAFLQAYKSIKALLAT